MIKRDGGDFVLGHCLPVFIVRIPIGTSEFHDLGCEGKVKCSMELGNSQHL